VIKKLLAVVGAVLFLAMVSSLPASASLASGSQPGCIGMTCW
jgi:hypothetical protein